MTVFIQNQMSVQGQMIIKSDIELHYNVNEHMIYCADSADSVNGDALDDVDRDPDDDANMSDDIGENMNEGLYDNLEPKLNIESLIEWYKLNGIRQFYLNEKNLSGEKMLKKDSLKDGGAVNGNELNYINEDSVNYKVHNIEKSISEQAYSKKSFIKNTCIQGSHMQELPQKALTNQQVQVQTKTTQSKITQKTPTQNQIVQSLNKKHSKEDMLANLKESMLQVECDLKYSANNFVFADGDCNANVMIVGEAPGEDEDIQCKPFVGRSGQLLRKALERMGMTNFYITNVVPFRPSYNRQPTEYEISLYLSFLKQHISIVRPKILLMAGSVSMNAVLKTNLLFESNRVSTISKMRGLVMNYSNEFMQNGIEDFDKENASINNMGVRRLDSSSIRNAILCMPIFHPSYLLRSSSKKVEYVKDLFLAKELCEIL